MKIVVISEPNEELVDDPEPIGSPSAETPPSSQPAVSEPKKKITLSFDEYKRLTNSIVIFIRKEEEKRLAEMEEGTVILKMSKGIFKENIIFFIIFSRN